MNIQESATINQVSQCLCKRKGAEYYCSNCCHSQAKSDSFNNGYHCTEHDCDVEPYDTCGDWREE